MIRTRLKLAATLTVVVLALTGFHTGHGSSSSSGGGSGKSKSRSGDSGGGCSSSKKSNDDYDGSGDSSGSSGSGGSGEEYTYDPAPTPTSTPTAEINGYIVDCVKPAQPKRKGKRARKADTTVTVKIVSEAYEPKTVRVVVRFLGAGRAEVDRVESVVRLDYRERKTFEFAMKNPKAVDRVKDCEVYDVTEVSEGQATATPSATSS